MPDPYSSETKSLNARLVLVMREIGRAILPRVLLWCDGHAAARRPVSTTWLMPHTIDNMNAASAHLHRLKGIDPQDILARCQSHLRRDLVPTWPFSHTRCGSGYLA